MSNEERIDLVLVEFGEGGKPYLFEAPKYTFPLEEGLYVLVDTRPHGKSLGRIVGRQHAVRVGSDDWNFIVAATKATMPLQRVLGYFKPIEYADEQNTETEKEEIE